MKMYKQTLLISITAILLLLPDVSEIRADTHDTVEGPLPALLEPSAVEFTFSGRSIFEIGDAIREAKRGEAEEATSLTGTADPAPQPQESSQAEVVVPPPAAETAPQPQESSQAEVVAPPPAPAPAPAAETAPQPQESSQAEVVAPVAAPTPAPAPAAETAPQPQETSQAEVVAAPTAAQQRREQAQQRRAEAQQQREQQAQQRREEAQQQREEAQQRREVAQQQREQAQQQSEESRQEAQQRLADLSRNVGILYHVLLSGGSLVGDLQSLDHSRSGSSPDPDSAVGIGILLNFIYHERHALAVDLYSFAEDYKYSPEAELQLEGSPLTVSDSANDVQSLLIGYRYHFPGGFYLGGGIMAADISSDYTISNRFGSNLKVEYEPATPFALTLGYQKVLSKGLSLGAHFLYSLPTDVKVDGLALNAENAAATTGPLLGDLEDFSVQNIGFTIGYAWGAHGQRN